VKFRICYSNFGKSFWIGNPWFVKSIFGFAEDGDVYGSYVKHNRNKTNQRMAKWLSK